MRRLHVLALIALTAVGVLASAGGASAAPGDPFQYQSSFPGVDNPVGVVVNHASGNVLVFQQGQIKQFDSTGKPADFAALGSPTIAVGGGMDMAIDNTGGATQGNIYVFEFAGCCGGVSGNLWSFAADGSTLGTSPNSLPSGLDFHGLGVLPDGTLRSVAFDNFVTGQNVWVPTDEVGQPVGPNGLLPLNGQFGPFTFDELGNYYAPGGSTFRKYAGATDFADLGETGLPVGSSVASDPSTNDLYTRQGTKILGVHYSDPLVESGPFEALDGIAATNDAFGFDGSGQTLYVAEGNRVSVFHRQPNSVPHGLGVEVTGVHSSSAGLNGQFSAGGVQASYHFEYGADASYGNSSPEVTLPLGLFPAKPSLQLEGLRPGTTYHARLVATNALGTTYGPDRVFKTYPTPTGADPCPNALARKQTLAASLLDCRAYELVSAADTGGYDVESYLVPGQAPFGGYPLAMNPTRVLYATHSGAVPGPWNPTNKGPDPYVATRGESGWSTQYVGLPANINPQAGGFSSVLGEADSSFAPSPSPARVSAAPASARAWRPGSRCGCPTAGWSKA